MLWSSKKMFYLCTRNQEITDTQIRIDSLAQQVEHNTFNVGVLGSSPRRITKKEEKSLIINGYWRLFFFYSYIRIRDINADRYSSDDENILHPQPIGNKTG